jgi:hypothetical protein
MKKYLKLFVVAMFSLLAACSKDDVKTNASIPPTASEHKTLKVNTLNPGQSAIVSFENGRYISHMGFGDIDFGTIYFKTGSFLDGEAVLGVDNNGIGGPYISKSYAFLVAPSSTDFVNDVQAFNAAFQNFINGTTNPVTNQPFSRPNPDNFIQNTYGTVGVFKGILVRSHSAASTVIIRDPAFVPTTPASSAEVPIGGIADPNGGYWVMWGHDGIVSRVSKYVSPNYVYPFSFAATYTGTINDYHVVGNIKPTSTTTINFDTHVNPL